MRQSVFQTSSLLMLATGVLVAVPLMRAQDEPSSLRRSSNDLESRAATPSASASPAQVLAADAAPESTLPARVTPHATAVGSPPARANSAGAAAVAPPAGIPTPAAGWSPRATEPALYNLDRYRHPSGFARPSAPHSGVSPELHALIERHRAADPQQRAELLVQIVALTNKEFDQRHAQHEQQYQQLSARMQRVRESLDRRLKLKEDIVRSRVESLVGGNPELQWDFQLSEPGPQARPFMQSGKVQPDDLLPVDPNSDLPMSSAQRSDDSLLLEPTTIRSE